jgi:hypothetical protein
MLSEDERYGIQIELFKACRQFDKLETLLKKQSKTVCWHSLDNFANAQKTLTEFYIEQGKHQAAIDHAEEIEKKGKHRQLVPFCTQKERLVLYDPKIKRILLRQT